MDHFGTFPESGPKMIPENFGFTGDNSEREGPQNGSLLRMSGNEFHESNYHIKISSFTAGHHSLECNLVVPQGPIV